MASIALLGLDGLMSMITQEPGLNTMFVGTNCPSTKGEKVGFDIGASPRQMTLELFAVAESPRWDCSHRALARRCNVRCSPPSIRLCFNDRAAGWFATRNGLTETHFSNVGNYITRLGKGANQSAISPPLLGLFLGTQRGRETPTFAHTARPSAPRLEDNRPSATAPVAARRVAIPIILLGGGRAARRAPHELGAWGTNLVIAYIHTANIGSRLRFPWVNGCRIGWERAPL